MVRLPTRIDLLNALAPGFGTIAARNIAYGPGASDRLDIYRPRSQSGPLPVIIFFYGGSWQSGSRLEYQFVGNSLARLGFVVVIPDYRLYPAGRYPDFLHDAARAVAFTAETIADSGGDDEAIFVAGHSAGAYIALMLALAPDYLATAHYDRTRLAGAIGLAGPYDFLPITGPTYKKIFASAPDLADTQPINHVDDCAPPSLLIAGATDNLVAPANTTALAAKLRAVGAIVDTRIYPGIGHIRILLGLLSRPFLPRIGRDIRTFIARTLDDDTPGDRAGIRLDMPNRTGPG